mmetsp:Transcript_5358/g.20318  ORF Transcript_5358/g.20318 Transcript_5358/m.20318 type:complete len:319 (-) Transcript_5358:1081-2037(-)
MSVASKGLAQSNTVELGARASSRQVPVQRTPERRRTRCSSTPMAPFSAMLARRSKPGAASCSSRPPSYISRRRGTSEERQWEPTVPKTELSSCTTMRRFMWAEGNCSWRTAPRSFRLSACLTTRATISTSTWVRRKSLRKARRRRPTWRRLMPFEWRTSTSILLSRKYCFRPCSESLLSVSATRGITASFSAAVASWTSWLCSTASSRTITKPLNASEQSGTALVRTSSGRSSRNRWLPCTPFLGLSGGNVREKSSRYSRPSLPMCPSRSAGEKTRARLEPTPAMCGLRLSLEEIWRSLATAASSISMCTVLPASLEP